MFKNIIFLGFKLGNLCNFAMRRLCMEMMRAFGCAKLVQMKL